MIKLLSPADREAKTRHQIEQVDIQLTKEFSELPADLVHSEVRRVSQRLLAQAHFTDHVAVLTGRVAAEHLRAIGTPTQPEPPEVGETHRTDGRAIQN
jgi:hypothetical protein